jgi:hypothetical protein
MAMEESHVRPALKQNASVVLVPCRRQGKRSSLILALRTSSMEQLEHFIKTRMNARESNQAQPGQDAAQTGLLGLKNGHRC